MEFVAIHYGIGVGMDDLEPHHNPLIAAKVSATITCYT